MKAVVQRVKSGILSVDGKCISKIGKGYVVYLGVGQGDNDQDEDYIAKKVALLRVFEDENGKMNKSLSDVNGEILLVSQFTLFGDCSHGNRPSFVEAEKGEIANLRYLKVKKKIEDYGIKVKTGVFGADMQIVQHNDGPVTILIDSKRN